MGRQVVRKKVMTAGIIQDAEGGARDGQGGAGDRARLMAYKAMCVHTRCVAGIGDRRSSWGSVKQTWAQRLNDVLLPLSSVQDQASRIGSLRKLGMSMGVNPRKV